MTTKKHSAGHFVSVSNWVSHGCLVFIVLFMERGRCCMDAKAIVFEIRDSFINYKSGKDPQEKIVTSIHFF